MVDKSEYEQRLMEFAGRALLEARGDNLGCDWDGGDIQDVMEKVGLLERVHVTEPCDPHHCGCAEWDEFPQECLRPTELGKACEEIAAAAKKLEAVERFVM